ncbi:hypothetical protein QQF64_007811 [Cirrhinus molitorella]|uniref:Gypsy retrotransposon integrase-like protein 1 n=1 Tax=Cirrhinus molitorella TaxID=172907 RepID=A0ABR3M4C8_9TELE
MEQQPAPHPLPHFAVKQGLLSCVAQRRGEVKELLMVPKGKVEMVMELAHAHPMAGHLGAANTAQRIRDRFHWPGLDGDVKRFCQACPTCQLTAPRMPPPSPLIPLPIIGVPAAAGEADQDHRLPSPNRRSRRALQSNVETNA